ncbi:1,2-phenylacetyl-CoA epoxidase subunit PaaC [Nakamurella sp. GG22]
MSLPDTAVTATALAEYVTGLGDDALILAQRLGEWVTHAPQIEEDIALANIALDLLGQASTLLAYAGGLGGAGRTEDDLAFLRDEHDFRNVHLVEIPNGDFAVTIARQLVFSGYQYELYRTLLGSTDPILAGLAGKAVKEVAYHRDHARQWTLRLGDGTAESHRRMQDAVDRVWPYVDELFDPWPVVADLAGLAADPVALRAPFEAFISATVTEATLDVPQPVWHARGGRRGVHTEHIGHLLPEMQYLHRAHPGAKW